MVSLATLVTRQLVFGTITPSSTDYNQHIRPERDALNRDVTTSWAFDAKTYMANSAGRYAFPSLFSAVEKFFSPTRIIPPGLYSFPAINSGLFGLGISQNDLNITISHYGTDPGSADYPDRAFIFGTSNYLIDFSNANFIVDNFSSESRRIMGLRVYPNSDNFDFTSNNIIAQLANGLALRPRLDPYNLGRTVEFVFPGPGKSYANYNFVDFTNDSQRESLVNLRGSINWEGRDIGGITTLIQGGLGNSYIESISQDPFLSYKRGSQGVIYGTVGANFLTPSDYRGRTPISQLNGYLLVGGAGSDVLGGGDGLDELQGGDGDDYLIGGRGMDVFIGGPGNDKISGDAAESINGSYGDIAVFSGTPDQYKFLFLADGSIQVQDKTPNRDGTDTLFGIKRAEFRGGGGSQKIITEFVGQDLAFVVDTTGSMGDNIGAVKSNAISILNALFDNAPNSRIAVVGYNDPTTQTFLSFTNQPDIDDRKTAAINGINSLFASGGGDFPEAVNAGLLRALSGGAGAWRSDAEARRIILFGDAPPNDNQLRSQVLALAVNTNTSIGGGTTRMAIDGNITTTSLTDGLAVTRFAVAQTNAAGISSTVPVEIFTVQIGNDSTTAIDFTSLANATGGRSFQVGGAANVVEALLSAIRTPTNIPPIAVDDSGLNTTFETPLIINSNILLLNDTDPNANPLILVDAGNAKNGTVTLDGQGRVTFTPNKFFVGTATFDYTVNDGKGATDVGTVN